MRLTFLIFFSIFLICSCSRRETSKDFGVIQFPNNPIESMNLSALCSSIEYIRLETSSKCLINNIDEIKFFGDSIFIINETGWNMKDILIFNTAGKFLGNFGEIGQGPEELDLPRDIIRYGENYLIWDRTKVVEFDKEGRFKRKLFEAFLHGNKFFIDSDMINLYHATEYPGMITQYDFNGNLLNTIRPLNPNHINSAFVGENVTHTDAGYNLFAPSFDTVWTIMDNKIKPRYIFDFDGEMTLQVLYQNHAVEYPPAMMKILGSNPTSNVLTYLENDDHLLLITLRNRKRAYKIIRKDDNRQLDFISCINDIDNGLFETPITLTENMMVIPLHPTKIIDLHKRKNSDVESPFVKLAQDIKETDNPVLMLCRLKF